MSTTINTDDGTSSIFSECDGAAEYEEVHMKTRAAISHATTSSLLAYFQRVNWPLNNILPRGEAFIRGELGNIVNEHGLLKAQVS